MIKFRTLSTICAAFALGALAMPAAQAQFPGDPVQPGPAPGAPVSTLRTPLIQGHPSAPAFIPPAEGAPPAIGDGATPAGVTGGHSNLPVTLLPWVPVVPSNQIDQGTSGIPLPVDPAITSPPGVLGPALTGLVPAPPSTPGADPGSLTAPAGSFNASQELNINPGGGIPGTGGFYTSIPTVRRGGQETHQYGYRGMNSILGGGSSDGSQDNIERLGPWAGFGTVTGGPARDAQGGFWFGGFADPEGNPVWVVDGACP